MKKYMIGFVIILSVLVGQDKYQFFLESDENLKLAGENYDIIKAELDKMLSEYNSKIDLSEFYKVKYTETIYTGPVKRDLDAINAELERYMKNGLRGVPYSQWTIDEKKLIMDRVEEKHTYRPSKTVTKESNRLIERGETLFTKEAEWSDIVSYYGGYSELRKLGISKSDLKFILDDDKSKFDVAVVFEKIELTGPTTCLAHVKINGNDDALKFHKIPKSTYKYKGNYKINYDKDYLALYNGPNGWMHFKFDEKKYLPKTKTEIYVQLSESIFPSTTNYRNTVVLMLEDLIPIDILLEYNQLYSNLSNRYLKYFDKKAFKHDMEVLNYEEINSKIDKAELLEKDRAQREKSYERNRKEREEEEKREKRVTAACLDVCAFIIYIFIG